MSIDFITKLPKSKDPVTGITYDLIMVIVDRFTKYLIVVLFKETHTAKQSGHFLLDRLVRDHRVPITVITDRDELFTSNYWKTISAAILFILFYLILTLVVALQPCRSSS